MPTLRARIGTITYRMPLLHRFLQTLYRALPVGVRQEKLVYDHLRKVVKQRRDQTFVLVGANDGMYYDHLFHFARVYGWKGAAVEPNPMFFKKLKANYAALPNVVPVNKAVHRTERSMPLYYLDSTSGLPDWMQGVGSFDRDQVLASTRDFADVNARIEVIDVACATLSEIIEEAGLDHVDVFVIDVEGYDAEVVRQIDLARWRPHTIVFEYRHLPQADVDDVKQLLQSNGYQLKQDHEDMLAFMPGDDDAG